MVDDEIPGAVPARHLASVQAWRAQVPTDDGEALDAIVVQLGTDDGDLPPVLVPVDAVPGLVTVLLDAAGLGPGSGDEPSVQPVGGEAWARLLGAERVPAIELDRPALPTGPGAYAWFRGGRPVHLGRAVGKRGLRARIGGDALRGDGDWSRSPFRSSVATHLVLSTTERPSPDDVEAVDRWIDGCAVAWTSTATSIEATALEAALRTEHDPAPGRR